MIRSLLIPAASLIVAGHCVADVVPPTSDVSGVLDAYIAREQPGYGWHHIESRDMPAGVTMHRLELTSQKWMNIEWKHTLNILVPPRKNDNEPPDAPQDASSGRCILLITSGDERAHAQVGSLFAARVGVPFAILHQIPNQPLFKEQFRAGHGLWEDALIAQTFLEFSRSGDVDWPLLLPMTRAVVSAMDAIGEFSQEMTEDHGEAWAFGLLDKFLTTGASKRGWTTWLSAAADKRVFAIAPMVFDNLNLVKQIPLHYATWGEPSPSIHDYTERGLLDILQSERGVQLMNIVDPFAYRDRLSIPKLLLIGTNDPYWPLAAIHQYIDDVPGPTWCHYEPNTGHNLSANVGVLFAIAGFFDAVTGRTDPLPRVSLRVDGDRATVSIIVPPVSEREDGVTPSVLTPRAVRILATRATRGGDFRQSRWQTAAAAKNGDESWELTLTQERQPASDRAAAYIAEVELADRSGNAFTVHSPVVIVDAEREED